MERSRRHSRCVRIRNPGNLTARVNVAPSKTMPAGAQKPLVTVVTVQGSEGPGVTIETDPGTPPFAVQIRAPSKASSAGRFPRLEATVVTVRPAVLDPRGRAFPER